MITNDMKLKDQRNDKSSTKIDKIPNATVDEKSMNAKVASDSKKECMGK